MRPGAYLTEDGCEFTVWAPLRNKVELTLVRQDRTVTMKKAASGYWTARVEEVSPGDRYTYVLDGEVERADPASFYQPEGVHGPSEVVDHGGFRWEDSGWRGVNLEEMVIYEVHPGVFTPEGTFEAIVPRLDELASLGVNALEVMPVAQFPGERNWGYDGTYPYAPQNTYGGPVGLKTLVNECHKRGMAVFLDVVYNHLGPEGNYLRDFGPYFTDRYKTPWGEAVNLDGPWSNQVRDFFIENAMYWFRLYHLDALRLDAVHAIFDTSARHFLSEMADRVGEFSREMKRKYYLVAENDLNDPRLARPPHIGGMGLDGLWCDDFHHSVHTLLTGEDTGYYVDFGSTEHLVRSLEDGYVYTGQYSEYRKKNHGAPSSDIPPGKLVVFAQNHDQTGNRFDGNRLSELADFESLKLSAAVVVLSPYVPLIFMGEEYGERAPFLYFTSHNDPDLIEAVRTGRKKEFESFEFKAEPPDPQSVDTFERSKVDWSGRASGEGPVLLALYQELIKIRTSTPALASQERDDMRAWANEEKKTVFMEKWNGSGRALAVFNFGTQGAEVEPGLEGSWKLRLDTADARWGGPGTILPESAGHGEVLGMKPKSACLYVERKR